MVQLWATGLVSLSSDSISALLRRHWVPGGNGFQELRGRLPSICLACIAAFQGVNLYVCLPKHF